MGEHVEARGASSVSLDEILGKPLREDLTLARCVPASETPGCQTDPEPPTMRRKIAEDSSIAAVHRGRCQPTRRTGARGRRAMRVDDDPVNTDLVSVDEQSWRDQLDRHNTMRRAIRPSLAEAPKPLSHSGFIGNCTQNLRQSQCSALAHTTT